MAKRRVGAAVVVDPEAPRLGIITERDILLSIGDGQDPDTELVADHLTPSSCSPPRTGRSSRAPRRWSAAASATSS